MALIVEDGTGLATANTYASVATANAYFTARGITTWTGIDALKEAALIRGSFALDGMYGTKWPGFKASLEQAMDWPRTDADDIDGYDLDGVPIAVVNAACEAALIELASAGSLTSSGTAGVKVETVGPISTEYFSASGSKATYRTISSVLSRIVSTGSGAIKLSRG